MSNKLVKFTPSVSYRGNVKLSIVTDNGEILRSEVHNKGTGDLFKFISRSLCGESVFSSAPNKVDAINSDEQSVISGGVGISDRRYEEFGDGLGWSAVFRATIPNRIKLNNISGVITFQIKYVDESQVVGANEIVFAEINVDSQMLNQLAPGTSLTIEWVMNFSNAEE